MSTGFVTPKYNKAEVIINGQRVYYSDVQMINGIPHIYCFNCGEIVELNIDNEIPGDGFAECKCGCHMDYWEGSLGGVAI